MFIYYNYNMDIGECPITEEQLHPPLIVLPHHKEVNFLPNPEMAVKSQKKRKVKEKLVRITLVLKSTVSVHAFKKY